MTGNNTMPNDNIVKAAAEQAFTHLISLVTSTFMMQPTSTPKSTNATLSTLRTKLLVVTPIAYIIVGILFLVSVCNVCLIWRSARNQSILQEEPVSLVGWAVLLDRSDVSQFISEFRRRNPEAIDTAKHMREHFSRETTKCYYDRDAQRIVMDGFAKV
jgi:hypothetical protein